MTVTPVLKAGRGIVVFLALFIKTTIAGPDSALASIDHYEPVFREGRSIIWC
jgi:hypothetical protein